MSSAALQQNRLRHKTSFVLHFSPYRERILHMKPPPIHFVYPGTTTFAGQTIACIHAIEDLTKSGFTVHPIEYPAYDRSGRGPGPLVRYACRLLKALAATMTTLFSRQPVIIFSHTQTLGGLVRMGLPHLVLVCLRPSTRVGVVLHGGMFLTWEGPEARKKLFMKLIRSSALTTANTHGQRDRLINDGANPNQVAVLFNTIDFDPMPIEELRKTTSNSDTPPASLNLTFVSALLDTKGFVEFLEAANRLAQTHPALKLTVTLCGPIAFSAYCKRFQDASEKHDWIVDMLTRLNAHPLVEAEWKPRVEGEDKKTVYRDADVVVLPSTHPMESSPLILPEAMASGCAIVTSRAGSIEEIVDPHCAILIDKVDSNSVFEALDQIARTPGLARTMARAGLTRFYQRYTREHHRAFWENAGEILTGCPPDTHQA